MHSARLPLQCNAITTDVHNTKTEIGGDASAQPESRTDLDSKVADYWDKHTDESFREETYWLANPEINRRHQPMAARGRDYPSWVNFSVEQFLDKGTLSDQLFKSQPRKPVDCMLSIGCGDGAPERHLASINTAKRIEGIELAPKRIEIAREEARKAGVTDMLHYSVCNAETSDFPSKKYDAIHFNSSLHHMSDLDTISFQVSRRAPTHGLPVCERIHRP